MSYTTKKLKTLPMDMDNKEIRKHLKQVHTAIVDALHEPLKSIVRDHTYFAGGCIASLIQGTHPKDYDLFFDDVGLARHFSSYCYMGMMKPRKQSFSDSSMLYWNSPSVFATTFKLRFRNDWLPVQFIHSHGGKPEDTIKTFDFGHTQNYYLPQTNHLLVLSEWLVRQKYLHYNPKSEYPCSAMKRVLKFQQRGYQISDQEFDKIMAEIQKIKWTPENIEKHKKGMYAVSL